MKNNTQNTKKILDQSTQEAIFDLREFIHNMPKNNTDDLKELIRVLEKVYDNDKTIALLLNISEEKVKTLSNREQVKLDAIMKKLFETSPRMFLGTIDNLYETNYRQQYLAGSLVDSDIEFLPTEFIRETFRFEVLKADLSIKIKDSYYQIEIQTSHDNMAIRFARYGLEIGLKNCRINPETGALKIELPEQSVIYLENNKNNPRSNDYEFWWQNVKLAIIKVKDLKVWELDIDDMIEQKLYNLLPMTIFKYRIELNKDNITDEEKLKLKDEFLEEAKQILKQAKTLSDGLVDGDTDTIVTTLGELINYFDSEFFGGTIERMGEFKMTFTEEIKGYRTQINTAEAKGLAKGRAEGEAKGLAKGLAEGEAKGLAKGKAEGKAEGLAEGEIKGEIKVLYTRMKMSDQEIAKELKMPLKTVKEIIKELTL